MCCRYVSATDSDAPMVTVPWVTFPSEITKNIFHLHPFLYGFRFIPPKILCILYFVYVEINFHGFLKSMANFMYIV